MLIDVNAALGHWPFMHFAQDTAGKLAQHLAAEGVGTALVSAIDAALYPDPHVCNLDLAEALTPYDNLLPLMTIDPTLSHWRECLAEYQQRSPLNAVRLQPNYHRYELAETCVDELVDALGESGQPVLVIQMRLEDERNQYPLMQIPGVPVDAIIALAQRHADLRLVCLCPYRPEAIELLQSTDNVVVDTSFIEFMDTLASVLTRIPVDRLLFGSHTPFLYTRANVMKLECATISAADKHAIGSMNAATVFGLSPD